MRTSALPIERKKSTPSRKASYGYKKNTDEKNLSPEISCEIIRKIANFQDDIPTKNNLEKRIFQLQGLHSLFKALNLINGPVGDTLREALIKLTKLRSQVHHSGF